MEEVSCIRLARVNIVSRIHFEKIFATYSHLLAQYPILVWLLQRLLERPLRPVKWGTKITRKWSSSICTPFAVAWITRERARIKDNERVRGKWAFVYQLRQGDRGINTRHFWTSTTQSVQLIQGQSTLKVEEPARDSAKNHRKILRKGLHPTRCPKKGALPLPGGDRYKTQILFVQSRSRSYGSVLVCLVRYLTPCVFS